MFVEPRKNMFQKMRLLREAPGDDANDIMNTEVDDTTTNTDPNTGEAENANDEDLDVNVDLNLDDPGTGGNNDNEGNDNDNNDDLDLGDDTTDAATSDNDGPEEEVKKGNRTLYIFITIDGTRNSNVLGLITPIDLLGY